MCEPVMPKTLNRMAAYIQCMHLLDLLTIGLKYKILSPVWLNILQPLIWQHQRKTGPRSADLF